MDAYLMANERTANMTGAASAGRPRDEALRWFDELSVPLRRYLLCSGASPADADDAVQETFLRLYHHLAKDADRTNLSGWVFQVARNYLRDERKSARRKRTVQLDDAMVRKGGPADSRGSPEHCAFDEERSRLLRAAIKVLPEQQRECILLRSSGLRYREIAAILGINTSSAGALVHRAAARLSEELS
jgi:RNA polymerase sigma-70 factor (ECF subfamily)